MSSFYILCYIITIIGEATTEVFSKRKEKKNNSKTPNGRLVRRNLFLWANEKKKTQTIVVAAVQLNAE